MSCNCGGNDYNISIGNNGNCEPSTPEYYISLGGVGVNGYSPVVNFVNQTEQSFSIEVDDINGIDVSDPVPKLSYVSDQLNNINTTIANLGNTYLTVNGSNAANPIVLNHLTMGYQYGSPYINSDGNLYIRGAVLSLQATGDINLSTTGTSKAYYNNNEIATVNNLDTYLKTDGSNINRDFSITNHSFTINNTTIDDSGRIIGNTSGALYLRDAGGNTSLSINSQGVSMLNNVGQSFTINNKQIATVDQIPTVGNGTITITQDGVNKGTFTTNQSGNTTINLDSGVTNPLTITDEVSSNFLQFIVNDSGSYIRSGTQGLSFNGYLINTVDNPLSLDDVAFGLKAIALKYDNDTIKVNQNGQLYADVQGGGGSYTAGTGIDITNDTISVDNTVAMKTDIPTVNNGTVIINQGGTQKGTFTLNQSGNVTIDLDAGSTGGAVDSVNGQTGVVVLDASDVGALPDTTVIPTKTSDLTNDSNFATVSQIPTNNNQLTNGAGYITITALNGYATQTWVGQQGYLTSSDLANYVTNSTLTTTLADYQPLLDSGTNIKTINNTSLLGSGNINVLTNTASSNTSLTVGGTASTTAYSTNVGFGSQATASAGQAFGHYAIASGSYSLALGQGAEANNSYGIQIGKGTNSTARSLSIGFGNNGNYQLLDGTTGLIPDTRISSNIARTSNVADTDLSNLSTTGQAVIDGKVSKSGDTMTGALNINVDTQNQLVLVNPYITKGTNPSERKYYGLYFNDSQNLSADDWKDTRLACIETSVQTNGTVTTTIQAVQNVADGTATAAGLNLNMTSSGVASCSFPNTTCVDGQWVKKNATIASSVSTSTTDKTYSLSSYLPNDGYDYEVLFWGYATSAATSGKFSYLSLSTDLIDAVVVAQARTRTSATVDTAGACILPVGTGRRVVWNASDSGNLSGTFNIYVRGYRRIGTNS